MQLPGRRAVLIGAVVLVGVAVLTVLLLARPPGGVLLAADPAQDATVPAPPQTIALTFSGDVAQAHIGVSRATVGAPVIAGATVQQPVGFMAAGRHLVTYHVVTQAGDEIVGTLAFTVTGDGDGHAPPTTPAVSPAEADAADRLTEPLNTAPAGAEDQPDPAILALSSGHDHGSIDPATGFVLAVNVVVLLVIGVLSVRRRIRLRRLRHQP